MGEKNKLEAVNLQQNGWAHCGAVSCGRSAEEQGERDGKVCVKEIDSVFC